MPFTTSAGAHVIEAVDDEISEQEGNRLARTEARCAPGESLSLLRTLVRLQSVQSLSPGVKNTCFLRSVFQNCLVLLRTRSSQELGWSVPFPSGRPMCPR